MDYKSVSALGRRSCVGRRLLSTVVKGSCSPVAMTVVSLSFSFCLSFVYLFCCFHCLFYALFIRFFFFFAVNYFLIPSLSICFFFLKITFLLFLFLGLSFAYVHYLLCSLIIFRLFFLEHSNKTRYFDMHLSAYAAHNINVGHADSSFCVLYKTAVEN